MGVFTERIFGGNRPIGTISGQEGFLRRVDTDYDEYDGHTSKGVPQHLLSQNVDHSLGQEAATPEISIDQTSQRQEGEGGRGRLPNADDVVVWVNKYSSGQFEQLLKRVR